MTSAKLLSILRDLAPEYHHAKFGGNWKTNKGKTEEGHDVPKYPSLNRLKITLELSPEMTVFSHQTPLKIHLSDRDLLAMIEIL